MALTLAKKSHNEAMKRLEKYWDGKPMSGVPCENHCGDLINITTFSYFMLPESEGFKVVLCCARCALALHTKHNYSNKN